MKRRGALVMITSIMVSIFVTCSLSMQAQVNEVTTDSRDLTGATTPVRIIVTRNEQADRTTEISTTQGPSINGGYARLVETEQETVQLNSNTTKVVTRRYSSDANGKRQLLYVTEEQRSNDGGGRETVVRATSSVDVNGRLQVVEREVQETVPISDDTRQTTSTVFRNTANGLQPVQRSQQVEQQKGDIAEQRTTVLAPDLNGNFVSVSRTESTTTKMASGFAKDERTYGDNGLGQMTLLQRDMTSESNDTAQGTQTVSQRYSAYVPGAAPDHRSLVLVQRISASRQTAPDGSSLINQQIQAINLGNPASGLQLATSITGISQNASKVLTEHQVVRSSDGNGAFPIVRITDSHGTRVVP